MIGGSSLFGIDISKGVFEQVDVEHQPVTPNNKVQRVQNERNIVQRETIKQPVNVVHVLPEKVNDLRHDLLQETEHMVDDLYHTEQEHNL